MHVNAGKQRGAGGVHLLKGHVLSEANPQAFPPCRTQKVSPRAVDVAAEGARTHARRASAFPAPGLRL